VTRNSCFVARLLSIIIPIQTFCQYLLASSAYLPFSLLPLWISMAWEIR